jgi:hypothetical protein
MKASQTPAPVVSIALVKQSPHKRESKSTNCAKCPYKRDAKALTACLETAIRITQRLKF